jgi:hypothetical protein
MVGNSEASAMRSGKSTLRTFTELEKTSCTHLRIQMKSQSAMQQEKTSCFSSVIENALDWVVV